MSAIEVVRDAEDAARRAASNGVLAGFLHGCTGRRGQWWGDLVATHSSTELVDEWVGAHRRR